MFEELNERRKVVECNIAKGFGIDDADLDLEKALEDEFEKGRTKKTFAVGDTFTRHGITYKCTGISTNTGRPTWSKVKDGEGSKQEQPEQKSGSGYGKKIPDEQVKSFSRILKQVDAMHTDARRHIDEDGMDDEQLANFKVVIDTFKNDQSLNVSTRRNIANWGDLVDEEIKFRKEQSDKKEDKEESLQFDVDLEVADEMWTGKESKAYDKALESDDKKEQKRLLKIAIDRAKEKGVDIARKKDSDSMKGVTRHMSPGQEEEAFKQAMQSKKPAKEEKQKPKKLSELKRGDTVALIMERYNPQLGDYVTIKKVQIEGTTSKSFKVDYMKFDKETGERSDKSSSVYGSSKHYILLPEEVNTHIKDGKWKGDRISGGNPFEDE